MRKIIAFFTIAFTVSVFAFRADKDDKFTVDAEKSSMQWHATKVTGQHDGTVNIKEGSLIFNGETFKGGSFVIDMGTIINTDGSGKNLLNHLKSDEFFGVKKFPISTFTITNIAPLGKDQFNITGDLTIKGVTNPVTFPATVKKQGKLVAAVAKNIVVDRTKYGIKFRSKNFFENLGNNIVDDEFKLSVNLLAKK